MVSRRFAAVWGALGPAAPRYAVTIEQSGQIRVLEMETRAAARAARRLELRPDGALAYEFAPGRHAYIVQHGNPGKFAGPQRVPAFPAGAGGIVRVNARGEGGTFGEGTRLYVQHYDDRQRLAAYALTLRGASQTMSFRAPAGATMAAIAVRIAGAGVLPPLTIGVRFAAADAPSAAPAAQSLASFDRLALLAGGAASRIAGVYDPAGPLAGRRLDIRPDQGVPLTATLPVAGLVFDDTVQPPFGWQGTFDANTYANLALIRILDEMERAGLPTVLVYDERTEAKPLFPELSALFSHQLRTGPEAGARIARILQLA